MKKLLSSLLIAATLLTNGVVASAATTNDVSTKSNAAIVSVTDSTVFHPQSQDPDGW